MSGWNVSAATTPEQHNRLGTLSFMTVLLMINTPEAFRRLLSEVSRKTIKLVATNQLVAQ